ncbi:hypothetical protein [Xenorhabdus ishibashii]|uniref:Uncharacterized protein n=1 Tax=Xenorhabdus ishibashii TaxID=1034471 RepID=A0A2D0KJ52_9GAMM|nr:hypothetical protein [Xenorhabdus ishibashii]PHM63335.1 hypothetical protein Xish_02576 [Xenorhabdus ishibashii]
MNYDLKTSTDPSIEVKNYNIGANTNNLINNVVQQAVERQKNLPAGMKQLIVIDIRGQVVSEAKRYEIIQDIIRKSNGVLGTHSIDFKR